MKNTSNNFAFSKRIILITTLIALAYSVVRYHIFGGVPWKDFPIYVLNKVVSFAALILLALNFSLGPLKKLGVTISEKWMKTRKAIGITAFIYVFIHVLMSISILKPHYYSAFFFNDGSLSLKGGLSLLGGILSFVFLWIYNTRFSSPLKNDKKISSIITSKKFLIYAMLFIGIHVYFLGSINWIIIENWLGGMPPISLISFVIFSITFLINFVGRK